MNTNITTHLFGESIIRNITRNGEPWFVIGDVCDVLELSNSRMVAARIHPEDVSTADVFTRTGTKTVNICNESGLYQLIFQSRKPVAKEFTRWVTSVILPEIRRTGGYNILPGASQQFIFLITEQIRLGVSPELSARLAARFFPRERAIAAKDPVASAIDDQEQREILSLLITAADQVDCSPRLFRSTELIALAREKGILTHLLGKSGAPDKSTLITFGKKLTRFRGITCQRSDGHHFELGKRDAQGGTTYVLRLLDAA